MTGSVKLLYNPATSVLALHELALTIGEPYEAVPDRDVPPGQAFLLDTSKIRYERLH